jgi:hydroxyacylglutathione hydrolase
MIEVIKFINKPINSNTYILFHSQSENCIIVDPGSFEMSDIINFITNKKKSPISILLTHEHFDHIYGVNDLINFNNNILICASQKTLDRIIDKRKNLSYYFDQKGYEVLEKNFIPILSDILKIDVFKIEVLKTSGHTDSSLSFLIDGQLFTGDFLIKNEITITKLPHGNKHDFQASFNKYQNCIYDSIIYPGHGEVFKLKKGEKI